MASKDEFDQIVGNVPELSEMDDGHTITVSGSEGEVHVTAVEFHQWVMGLVDHVLQHRSNWVEGIAAISGQQEIVIYAVVRDAYRLLAEYAFAQESPVLIGSLLSAMHKMVLFCREAPVSVKDRGVDHG